MKTNVVMPPPGEFSKPDAYSKKEMATCTTYCWRILEQMEEGISPETKSKKNMEKEDTKFW